MMKFLYASCFLLALTLSPTTLRVQKLSPIVYPPTAPAPGVILLTFDGYNPQNKLWGEYDSIPASNLLKEDQDEVLCHVAEYYKYWNVIVTKDSKLFYKYPVNKRVRVVITIEPFYEVYNIYGMLVSYARPAFSRYNALFLGDTTPALLSTSILKFNIHDISDGTSHEIGHIIGLAHQSKWEGSIKIAEYDEGDSLFAPIMGATYTAKKSGWTIGINSYGQYQNDTLLISQCWTRKKNLELSKF